MVCFKNVDERVLLRVENMFGDLPGFRKRGFGRVLGYHSLGVLSIAPNLPKLFSTCTLGMNRFLQGWHHHHMQGGPKEKGVVCFPHVTLLPGLQFSLAGILGKPQTFYEASCTLENGLLSWFSVRLMLYRVSRAPFVPAVGVRSTYYNIFALISDCLFWYRAALDAEM